MPKYKRTKMNAKRAAWADQCIKEFMDITMNGSRNKDDYHDAIGDLIADIMHLCAQKKIDFEERLNCGHEHFEVEASDYGST